SSHAELAQVERLEGRSAEAMAHIERAIAIAEKDAAAPTMTLVRRYRAKADLLLASGRLDAAQTAFARAETLFAKAGPDVEERALLQAARADLLRAAKRPADAIALYREALGTLEARYGSDGLALVDALLGLGAAELDAGDAAAAIASAE